MSSIPVPEFIIQLWQGFSDDPGPLIVFVGLAVLLANTAGPLLRKRRSSRWRRATRRPSAAPRPKPEPTPEPAPMPKSARAASGTQYYQKDSTPDMPGEFNVVSILNASERRLLVDLEALVPQHFPERTRIIPQSAMSGFLRAPSRLDWYTISAKRVDFLLVDAQFSPICVIEYQGAGHYGGTPDSQRNAARRDWEKRRALRRADLPLIEIPDRWDRKMLADMLGDLTGRRPAPKPQGETGQAIGRETRDGMARPSGAEPA